jgi:hypothetical protein
MHSYNTMMLYMSASFPFLVHVIFTRELFYPLEVLLRIKASFIYFKV